ncbi:hypothetical protein MnTg02_00350 [bacterium MnTg02]|nr:hypothetical protein MnTg02_00350 [bacterium MnTg02]
MIANRERRAILLGKVQRLVGVGEMLLYRIAEIIFPGAGNALDFGFEKILIARGRFAFITADNEMQANKLTFRKEGVVCGNPPAIRLSQKFADANAHIGDKTVPCHINKN